MNYTGLIDLLEDFAFADINKTLMCMEEILMYNDTSILGFCRGSASVLEDLSPLSLVLRPSHSVRILCLWWTLAELL